MITSFQIQDGLQNKQLFQPKITVDLWPGSHRDPNLTGIPVDIPVGSHWDLGDSFYGTNSQKIKFDFDFFPILWRCFKILVR
jgi:hypothetical protein